MGVGGGGIELDWGWENESCVVCNIIWGGGGGVDVVYM